MMIGVEIGITMNMLVFLLTIPTEATIANGREQIGAMTSLNQVPKNVPIVRKSETLQKVIVAVGGILMR